MTELAISIPVIRGKEVKQTEKEFREMLNYDSGDADRCARTIPGRHAEPWLNVIDSHEPSSLPGFELILKNPAVRARMRGKAMDVGAGTCWLSAKLSRLPEVDQVLAVDLSERFLATVGLRVMKQFEADLRKLTFVTSDFNDMPIESESADCAFLWASIHHSLTPIKTIREVGRCLKKGGTLFVFESPFGLRRISQARKEYLALSSNVTEIAYTRSELEYLFANANVGEVEALPLDVLTRSGWRRAVRHVVRRLGMEHVIFSSTTYLFTITKR
jgi:SAM-dependent methyltransferase